MSSLPEVGEIADHLTGFMIAAKRLETRQMVKEFVATEFNAVRNYCAFVEQCTQVARRTDVGAGSGIPPVPSAG